MAEVTVDMDRWNAAKSSGTDEYFIPEDLRNTPYGQQLSQNAGDILAAQVAAMSKTNSTENRTLIGSGSGVEIWVPNNPGTGDAPKGETDTTESKAGFGDVDLPSWIGKYLGGAALFIIGLVLIALAVWATIQDNK